MSQMLMPFMRPDFVGPIIPRGVAPGMEIMPYTGPGSAIVPLPKALPAPITSPVPFGAGFRVTRTEPERPPTLKGILCGS